MNAYPNSVENFHYYIMCQLNISKMLRSALPNLWGQHYLIIGQWPQFFYTQESTLIISRFFLFGSISVYVDKKILGQQGLMLFLWDIYNELIRHLINDSVLWCDDIFLSHKSPTRFQLHIEKYPLNQIRPYERSAA